MSSENSGQNLMSYIAVIVYETTSGKQQHLYQESFVLFKTSSQEEAQQIAL